MGSRPIISPRRARAGRAPSSSPERRLATLLAWGAIHTSPYLLADPVGDGPDGASLLLPEIRGKALALVPLAGVWARPTDGQPHPIVGQISLGKGITIHHEDCPSAKALKRDPERFTPVSWDGESATSFRVELQVDGWDRHRLPEDLPRIFAEARHQHAGRPLHGSVFRRGSDDGGCALVPPPGALHVPVVKRV